MGNVFGLGILLTLEDQASNKLTGFGNSLQNLSQRAMSLNYMGKGLIETGKNMLSPVIGLSKEIVRVGDDAERTRKTLTALYGSSEVATARFNEVIAYAAKTPFGIEELKDATTQFKTLGVELFGTESYVTSATGKTRQMIDIIGDLGAGLSGVARNGFRDVVYASREFVTEGNKLSFLRRLGIDIDAVLEKGITAENTLKQLSLTAGETIEERKVALANLVEALNMDGLMESFGGTWQVMMSNMGDLWYQFCLKLSDAGAFNVFKEGIAGILEIGNAFNDSEFGDQFFLNLADAFKATSKPLDSLIGILGKAVAKFIELGATYPILTKLALMIPTVTGTLFVLAGAGLVAKASMMTFGYGLGVIVGMIPKLLLMAGIFGAIYVAWNKDIGGIRTRLTNFVDTLKTSMSKANEVLAMGKDNVSGMISEYKRLVNRWEKSGDFGAGFTAQIIKTKVLWGAFVDFLKDNKVDPKTLGILSDMGLMGTFEKIATWTARIKEFCSGFVQGFADMANAVGDFVTKVMSKLFPTMGGESGGLFNMMTGSFDMSSINTKGLGNFVAKALPAFLVLKKIVGIVNSISGRRNRHGLGDILRNLTGGSSATEATNNTRGFSGMLNSLGLIRVGTAVKGITNLGIILTAFMGLSTIFGGFVNLFGIDTIGKGIAALGALALAMLPLGTPAFDTLINTLQRLARFKVKTIGKGILNLGVIVGGIAAISAVSLSLMAIPLAFMDVGTIYAMVGVLYAIGFLGASLAQIGSCLGAIPVSTVALGLANMAIMVGGMAALFMILGAVSLIPFDYGRVAKLTLSIGLIGVVGAALVSLASGSGVASMASGGLYTGAIALGLANMAIMIAGLALVFMALGAVSLIPFDYGKIAKLVLCIGLIGVVGSVLSELGFIAGTIPTTLLLKGMGNIALALAGFGVLAYAFSYASKYADQIEKGCEVISKLAKGIGEAIGSLVGGLLAGITSGLPKIGENIAGFVTNLNPLISLAKNEDSTKIGTFFESLGKGLLALTKNDMLSFFTGGTDFTGLAKDLSTFVTDLDPFFKKVGTISEDGLEKAPKMFDALSKINNQAFMKGGVNDWWNGSIDLTSLGTQLSSFATAISPFYSAVSGVDESAFTKAESMFKSLEGINKQAFMQGGVNDWWNGSIDLTTLGTMLSNFSSAIAPFFNAVADIDETAFTKAESMFKSLEGINKQAFMQGGVNDWWNGKIDLSNLGTMLSSFASSSGSFWTKVDTWNETAFTKAESMFTALKSINDQAFTTGGVNDWWNGKIDLSNLGKMLSDFATNAGTFFTKINSIKKPATITTLFTALLKISDLNDVSSDNLPTLGTDLASFMTNAGSFFTDASTVDVSGLTTIATALEDFFNTINTVVVVGLTGLSTSVTTVVTSLTGLNAQLLTMAVSFVTIGASAVSCGAMVVVSMTMMTTSALMAGTSVITASALVLTGLTLMGASATVQSAVIVSAFTLMGAGVLIGVNLVVTGMNMMVTAILTGSVLMVAALSSACASCQGVLASFASSGYSYGASLVSNIAAGISANAGQIRSAIQSAVASAAGSVSISVPINVGQNYNGTNNWVGGLTTINERGGELVDLPSGTRIYPHDKSVTMAFDEGMRTAMENQSNGGDNSTHDDSVHFHAGSIVVHANGASEAEAERLAELIMAKIERKNKRKALATFTY